MSGRVLLRDSQAIELDVTSGVRTVELDSWLVLSCERSALREVGRVVVQTSPWLPPVLPAALVPGPVSFGSGVYWNTLAKAGQGVAKGECSSPGELCLPSSEPPPPDFRQCVQYLLPVNEDKLPQCPSKFPDRFIFYSGAEGKLECSPCECGEPVDAQCNASFSAFQDTTCAGAPMPLFENVPSGGGTCVDLAGMPYALGSMSAQWKQNVPGTCEPKGGQSINETKGADPRVFCCQ